MPEKTFRVNVYQVELTGNEDAHQLPFHNAIEAAIGLPLAQRYREVNEKGRRLENYERRDGCFLLNFVTGQYDGPGRTSPQTAVVPIPLAPNETFAYETAMLYDPVESMALVESSVGAMGSSAIAHYFKEFANPDTNYTLVPRLDDEAAARARNHRTIRKWKLRVAMGPVTDVDRASGLSPIKAFGEGYGAGFIDIEIKAQRERGRTLSLTSVWNSINPILGDDNENNVTQLIVTGRENDDDQLEPIDLLQHREKRSRSLRVDDIARKVLYGVRWDALFEIRREFL